MDVKKAAAILSRMETDALADVLNKVEKTKKKILIDLLEPEVRRDVEMIASFDEDEIGSRMTTNYIVITDKLTVKQAMSSLIEQAAKNDNISTIFVVTEQQKFYGAINLKELIIARRDDLLENLVVTSYPLHGNSCLGDSCPLCHVRRSCFLFRQSDASFSEIFYQNSNLKAPHAPQEHVKESLRQYIPDLLLPELRLRSC